MADHTNAEVSDERLPDLQQRLVTALYGPGVKRSDTVEELADALIAVAERRSVTSQASEGEVVDAGTIREHESTDEAMWRATILKDRGYHYLAASERLEQEAYDRAAKRGEHTGTDGI